MGGKDIHLDFYDSIRIGYLKILDHLLMGFAVENTSGLSLERTHHDVETVVFNSWSAMKEALCNRHIHGGFIPLPEAMELFNSGLDIKILLFDCRPGTTIVSNRAADVAKLSDFKGKTVLLSSLLSVHHLLFYRLMDSAGLRAGIENDSPADVFIEIVPPFMIPEMISCDLEGDIGGCIVEEPFASRIIHEGYGKKVCLSRMLWPDHPHTALVMHDKVIQDSPSSVSNLVQQMVLANQSVYRESSDLYLFSEKIFGRKNRIMEKVCMTHLQAEPLTLMPDIKLLEIINDFMVTEMGMLNTVIHMDEFVDLQFALEAGA